MKFQFIDVAKESFPVTRLCQTLGVSQSGYFAWRSRPASPRQREDLVLLAHIRSAFTLSNGTYGSPRMTRELQDEGVQVGRRRTARLMRENGLKARQKRRFMLTTDSHHGFPVAPNFLEQDFSAKRPNQQWNADIPSAWRGEGWLYLAVVEDLATREIVGWSMADHLRAGLCVNALVMALQRRRPPRGLIHHSDRGVQYAAEPYRRVLERHGVKQSMSRRGNCLDNAPMESFFASLKKEQIHHVRFGSREEAKAAVFDYIEVFYNRRRLHSALGHRTPAEARADMEGITMRAAA